MKFLLHIIFKNLMQRKTRTLLTICGISIGIAAVISLVALSRGMIKMWNDTFENRKMDLMVVNKGRMNAPNTSVVKEKYAEQLKTLPMVESLYSILFGTVTVEGKSGVFVTGMKVDESAMKNLKIKEGRLLQPEDKHGLLLEKYTAENFKKKVGEEIEVESDFFKVIGIYESGSIFETGAVVFKLDELQWLLQKSGVVTSVGIRVIDSYKNRLEEVKQKIEETVPSLTAITSSEAADFSLGVKMAEATAFGVSAIALSIGMIGTMNTMLMSIFERTKEIGILRALGWKRRSIMKMIIGESIIISILGVILGSILGIIALLIISSSPSTQEFAKPDYNPVIFVQGMIVGLVLGIIGGIYPAFRAAEMTPMVALRQE